MPTIISCIVFFKCVTCSSVIYFFYEFYESCSLGNSHKLHATLFKTKYNNLFDLIYIDQWGPISTPSSIIYNYYIAFVNSYSSYTWIYFQKNKGDALTTFTLFQKYVETQFQAKIKPMQSDFDGELRPFTKFLNAQGILHKLTWPHTSHQNGKVERKHIHIMELGLTLLAHKAMPITYWDHSFTTTVYLVKRLPTSELP